jgi:hypothetical protein
MDRQGRADDQLGDRSGDDPAMPENRLAHQIHVWRTSTDLKTPRLRALWSTLSTDERKRAERFRFPRDRQWFLEPGRVYAYNIDLWQIGITIAPGSRLRLEIASAAFPTFSRNLNTGGHNEMETRSIAATQRIYHSRESPSYVVLPVIPSSADGRTSGEPPAVSLQDSLMVPADPSGAFSPVVGRTTRSGRQAAGSTTRGRGERCARGRHRAPSTLPRVRAGLRPSRDEPDDPIGARHAGRGEDP